MQYLQMQSRNRRQLRISTAFQLYYSKYNSREQEKVNGDHKYN